MASRHNVADGVKPSWVQSMLLLNFRDFLTATNHDADFDASRSSQIYNRFQALSSLYAVVGFLWLFADYYSIPADRFRDIAVIRILMVISFIALAFWHYRPKNLQMARIRLGLLTLVPTVFFVSSSLAIHGATAEAAQLVYSFYPFVIVAQLAIFPLTLIEGLVLAIPAFVGIFIVGFVSDELSSISFFGNLVLALLLMFLATWAEVSQLRMLVRLYRQATRDPLTGMFNRRLLMERVKEEEARFSRSGASLSIMIIDLDKFKRVNDNYGHLAGDKVLVRFAEVAKNAIRTEDIVGRYGGEEFMVVLPNTTLAKAEDVAERIRKACEPEIILTDDNREVTFRVSIGVSQLQLGETGSNALERADTALYLAKETGRNRVEVAK